MGAAVRLRIGLAVLAVTAALFSAGGLAWAQSAAPPPEAPARAGPAESVYRKNAAAVAAPAADQAAATTRSA